jgi:predicted NAD-dependent protein-ADP-ribosyltransferase YbiA (DUF1768 family)
LKIEKTDRKFLIKMDSVLFYGKDNPNFEFSNFYEVEIEFEGHQWKSSEHIYQAQKFTHSPEYMAVIRNVDTAAKVYAIANQKKSQYSSRWYVNKNIYGDMKIDDIINISKQNGITIRSDWNSVKDDVMRKVVYAKFSQNLKLRLLLLNTENKILIENSPRDSYWGIGKDRSGKNMLGIILMEVRYTLFNYIPHTRCNFITSDHRILIGATPLPDKVNEIVQSGFNLFLDLREDIDYDYRNLLGNIPDKNKLIELINGLINEYKNGNRIYIHCKGGHGRAAMIASIFLGIAFNLNGPQVIKMIEDYREFRIDRSRNFIPTPETNKQINLIIEILGSGSLPIPSRDIEWMERIGKN